VTDLQLHTERNDSIEGRKIVCQARKCLKPKYDPIEPYGLNHRRVVINATAWIADSLGADDAVFDSSAYRKELDAIKGPRLSLRSAKGYTKDKLVHGSSRDQASLFYAKGHAMAMIKYSFRHAMR
jgi:hypothetical protein